MKNKQFILSIVFIMLLSMHSFAQQGIVDCSFGDLGMSIEKPEGKESRAEAVAVYTGVAHPGKIVVAGHVQNSKLDLVCVRYNANGTLDNTFHGDRVSDNVDVTPESDEVARGVAVLDGGTVIAQVSTTVNPYGTLGLVKFTASGTLDFSFGVNGKLIGPAGGWQGVYVHASGNIYTYGRVNPSDYSCTIKKYSSTGVLLATYSRPGYDNSYFDGGNVITDFGLIYQANYYTQYNVSFVNLDGSIISTQTLNVGNSATAPQDPNQTGYTFTTWDNDYTNVTSNLTVTAQYDVSTDISNALANGIKIYSNPKTEGVIM